MTFTKLTKAISIHNHLEKLLNNTCYSWENSNAPLMNSWGNLLFLHFRLHQLQRKLPVPKLTNKGIGTLIFLNSGSVCFGEIIIIHSSRGVEGIHVMSYRDLQCWTTHLSSPYRACLPCSCPC